MKKIEIWNSDYNPEDFLGMYREVMEDNYPEEKLGTDEELLNSSHFLDYCNDVNNDFLEDERCEFKVIDKKYPKNNYVAIADLGFWNGRQWGYKELSSLEGALYSSEDGAHWYVNEYGDLVADTYNHDAKSHIRYREWRNNITESQKQGFLSKIYDGTFTEEDVKRCTKRIGPKIKKHYGF